VALHLDSDRALRTRDDLDNLTRAILAARPNDETDWLEWKGTLDLGSRSAAFDIARTVLGFSNRMPESAARNCEGAGYLVVGAAAEGALLGATAVDGATLEQAIESYVGSGDAAPRMSTKYIDVDGMSVLVVTVEAPRMGDRIYVLRKAGGTENGGQHNAGTVFVRSGSNTRPANAQEMDALQRRLLSGPSPGAKVEVTLVGRDPFAWFDQAAVYQEIDRWVNEQVADMTLRAQAEEERLHPSEPEPALPTVLTSPIRGLDVSKLTSFVTGLIEPENRSLDQYLAQVEGWATATHQAVRQGFNRSYVAAGHGVLQVKVGNLGDRFISDLEVTITLEGAVEANDELPSEVGLPAKPRDYGTGRSRLESAMWPAISPIGLPPMLLPKPRLTIDANSSTFRFRVGDLRPRATDISGAMLLFVRCWPPDGTVVGRWTATARDGLAVVEGSVELQVSPEAVDHQAILREVIKGD
jgi:hypothetical protein